MIQRFNFYDIYGNLIPGLALVAVIWFPAAAITGRWPDSKLGSVVALLAAAYVIGHIMQSVALNVFSAKFYKNANGDSSYPSTVLLDPKDSGLDAILKGRIQKNVSSWFEIDVSVNELADKALGSRRQAAFFLCRPIVNARIAYAEQFQGLYTMMRGLASALFLCAFYLCGWILASYDLPREIPAAQVVIGTALALVAALSVFRRLPDGSKNRKGIDRVMAGAIAAALTGAGCIAGHGILSMLVHEVVLLLFCGVAISVFAALRFLDLYYYFAVEFAKAVWSNFAVEPTVRPSSELMRLSAGFENGAAEEA